MTSHFAALHQRDGTLSLELIPKRKKICLCTFIESSINPHIEFHSVKAVVANALVGVANTI